MSREMGADCVNFVYSARSQQAYELSTLTGTQVLLLVVSESGWVYTFTTDKFKPLVKEDENGQLSQGQKLIAACLVRHFFFSPPWFTPLLSTDFDFRPCRKRKKPPRNRRTPQLPPLAPSKPTPRSTAAKSHSRPTPVPQRLVPSPRTAVCRPRVATTSPPPSTPATPRCRPRSRRQ